MNKKLNEDDIERISLILTHQEVFPLPDNLRTGLLDIVMSGVMTREFGWAVTLYILGRRSLAEPYYTANFLRNLWNEGLANDDGSINYGRPDRAEFDRIARSHDLIP